MECLGWARSRGKFRSHLDDHPRRDRTASLDGGEALHWWCRLGRFSGAASMAVPLVVYGHGFTVHDFSQTPHGTAIYADQLGWFQGSMYVNMAVPWSVWVFGAPSRSDPNPPLLQPWSPQHFCRLPALGGWTGRSPSVLCVGLFGLLGD